MIEWQIVNLDQTTPALIIVYTVCSDICPHSWGNMKNVKCYKSFVYRFLFTIYHEHAETSLL